MTYFRVMAAEDFVLIPPPNSKIRRYRSYKSLNLKNMWFLMVSYLEKNGFLFEKLKNKNGPRTAPLIPFGKSHVIMNKVVKKI